MEMKVYQVAEADGLCYQCKKHVMKDCECFFGKLFINDQPERSKREDLTSISPLPKDLEIRLVEEWKKYMLS